MKKQYDFRNGIRGKYFVRYHEGRVYKKYKFGDRYRIKGPEGLDLSLSCVCAGCVSLYMNIAYDAGLRLGHAKSDIRKAFKAVKKRFKRSLKSL
jgi:hypothetical protein